jgi:hypothetical protein
MIEDMTVGKFAARTQEGYIRAVKARFWRDGDRSGGARELLAMVSPIH